MSRFSPRSFGAVCASGMAALAVAVLPAVTPAGSDEPGPTPALTASTILSGMSLSHTYAVSGTNETASEPLTDPDDITQLGGVIFVGFQNGVGPQGQPSGDGNTDSTVVALDTSGNVLAQWDIQGKCDGLTADPAIGGVIATVNEDANSSLYVVTPGANGGSVQHYNYSEPLPHNGGTDAISILGNKILISASAPGTVTGSPPAPQPTYPAVYWVKLNPNKSVATVKPYFYDEDQAAMANVGPQQGETTTLGLTDPDSNEIVPAGAPRFAQDFMLTSQGDEEQIFVGKGKPSKSLSVLSLSTSIDDATVSASVDDTAWATGPGVLYATDSTNDAIDALSGTFGSDPIVAVTPCGENSAPAICPSLPDYPPNYMGSLNPWTGTISPVSLSGAAFVPQGGLLFLPSSEQG